MLRRLLLLSGRDLFVLLMFLVFIGSFIFNER